MAASVSAMLLMAACSGVENGPVIGTPAQATMPVAATGANLSLSGLQQQLADQLSQVEETQSDPGGSAFAAEVQAIANDQALLSSERISQLQQLGENEVVTLEGDLSTLTADVQNTSGLSAGQADAIEYVIRQVVLQLQSLDAKIAADTLVDVLRTDVLSVESSTRVASVIEPEVHIALGADSLLAAASLLTSQEESWSTRVQAVAGLNQTIENQLLSNLASDISSLTSIGSSVAAEALALSPGGYPGNQGEIASLKTELTNATNSGFAASGHTDVASITTCVTDDGASPAVTCPS